MIVVDTHAWLWWVGEQKRLSKPALRALQRADAIAVPAICCWEVALLVDKRRIELDRSLSAWFVDALAEPRVDLLPLSPEIAIRANQLGAGFHGDPADRLIVASALVAGAALVTKDQRIADWAGVRCLW